MSVCIMFPQEEIFHTFKNKTEKMSCSQCAISGGTLCQFLPIVKNISRSPETM